MNKRSSSSRPQLYRSNRRRIEFKFVNSPIRECKTFMSIEGFNLKPIITGKEQCSESAQELESMRSSGTFFQMGSSNQQFQCLRRIREIQMNTLEEPPNRRSSEEHDNRRSLRIETIRKRKVNAGRDT